MREVLRLAKAINKVNGEISDLYITELTADYDYSVKLVKFEVLKDGFYDTKIKLEKVDKDMLKINVPSMSLEVELSETSTYYNLLKNEINTLLKWYSTVEEATKKNIIQVPLEGEILFKDICDKVENRCLDVKEAENIKDLKWKELSPSLAKYIIDVLNDTNVKEKPFLYNLETQRFFRHSYNSLVSDEEIIRLLKEEEDVLKNMDSNNNKELNLYKAINKEAIELFLNNEKYLLNSEDICGISVNSLREIGLNFEDIDYLRTLNLESLDDITYEQAKKLSIYTFSLDSGKNNREDFIKLFKKYKDLMEKEGGFEDSAIIMLEFGCADLELNGFAEEGEECVFEYIMCNKYRGKDNVIEWNTNGYTGVLENLDELIKIESLEKFEEDLFNLLIDVCKEKNLKWYLPIQ